MAVNNKISKKGTFGTTMGVTSIIAILVILVLIVFSALSITTSKADLNLAQKTARATSDFYIADGSAEENLAEIAGIVKSGNSYDGILISMGYDVVSDGDDTLVSYDVPINSNKSLFVTIRVGKDGSLDRESWQVRSTSVWQTSEGLDLIIG